MLTERNCSDKERAVIQVQKWLRGIAKGGTPLPSVLPDGIYGEETKEAVRIFQGLKGLDPTGVVDYATWLALCDAYDECIKKTAKTAEVYPFETMLRDGKLHNGDCMPLVAIVQAMIEEVRVVYEGIEEQKINGVYDDATVRNIISLQKKWNLEQTGELDREGWNMLAACYNGCLKSE